MRVVFFSVAAALFSIVARADAQTPATPPAAVPTASSVDVARVLDMLDTTTTILRTTAAKRPVSDASTRQLKLAIASLQTSQTSLRTYTAKAPVSVEYLEALNADALTLQRATATSQSSVLASQLRPVSRDLKAKAAHANNVTASNPIEFPDIVDEVAVTVKTRVHGVETPGFYVVANPWYGPQTSDARYIFGEPTPCTKTLSPGFYYFWIDKQGKPKPQKREVTGTNSSAEQQIYLDVE